MDWCCSVWRESAERREAEAVNGTTKGSECVWFAFKHPGEEIANEISVTTSLAELLLAHAELTTITTGFCEGQNHEFQ